jgi:hypothetical protein
MAGSLRRFLQPIIERNGICRPIGMRSQLPPEEVSIVQGYFAVFILEGFLSVKMISVYCILNAECKWHNINKLMICFANNIFETYLHGGSVMYVLELVKW